MTAVADVMAFAVRAEVGDALCEAMVLRNQLDALVVSLASSAELNAIPAANGLRTVAQYVASETNTDSKPVRHMATLARWLRDSDQFETAFAHGEMSKSHLQLIRTRLDGPRTHFELIRAQEILVDAARDCGFDDFTRHRARPLERH